MKSGKNAWIKPGAKVIVLGDDCWQAEAAGEILKVEGDQILVQVTETYWVTKSEIKQDASRTKHEPQAHS